MICTVYMHYNQLHIVENRYRLSVSALICYIISVIGISAKCCIGAPLISNYVCGCVMYVGIIVWKKFFVWNCFVVKSV